MIENGFTVNDFELNEQILTELMLMVDLHNFDRTSH